MRVLVTGGAGSLGRAVISRLSSKSDPPLIRVFDLPTADFTSLEGISRIELVKGDINDINSMKRAVQDVDAVVHLAAILPPSSELDRARTLRINVGGTKTLTRCLVDEGKPSRFVFSSSTVVYGETFEESPPVRVNHPLAPNDFYSESKILAEGLIRDSSLPYVILRVSGVAVPDLMELPERLPFRENQRIEFISRDDASLAFVNALYGDSDNAILNIAGGQSWQTRGKEYVEKLYGFLGLSEEAVYSKDYTWLDWYDTADSQRMLDYQETDLDSFVGIIKTKAREAGLFWR